MKPVRRNIKQPQQNYATPCIYFQVAGKGTRNKLRGYYNERNARLYTGPVRIIKPE